MRRLVLLASVGSSSLVRLPLLLPLWAEVSETTTTGARYDADSDRHWSCIAGWETVLIEVVGEMR